MEQNAIITGCVRTNDAEGVTISSHKGILLEAEEEIIIDSKTKVTFSSLNQIKMVTPTGGLSMENEMHFANMKTIIDCADDTELPVIEQPKPKKLETFIINKKQEVSGINWSQISQAAIGAIPVR